MIYTLLTILMALVSWYLKTAEPPLPYSVSTATQVIIEPENGTAEVSSYITHASSSIDVVMYQFEDQHIEQELAVASERGVQVRVLLNGGYWGKKENTDNDDAYSYLTAHGVAVRWTPSFFALTHEKSILIDTNRLIIMTGNLTPQYYQSSRDFDIVDTDQADIADAAATFDADWNGTTVAHPSSALVWSPGSQQPLVDLIDSATSSIDIYNEEMADAAIADALTSAAHRGVSVRILMTDNTRWHVAWSQLTEAGASVRYFAQKDPLYIHAKVIVVDASHAFMGSENFSKGSLEQNRELGILFTDPGTIGTIEQRFASDWSSARSWH